MYETLKNFKQIAYLTSEELTPEYVDTYKETQDSIILAKVFVKYFGHFKNITDRYFGLTEEDKASFVVEEIHKSLMNYDMTKGSIYTLSDRYIVNRLRVETENTNLQKRKANYAESYEGLIEEGCRDIEGDHEEQLVFELVDVIEKSNLTNAEKEYCKVFLLDRTQELADPEKDTVVNGRLKVLNTEIAELINVTPAGVGSIRNSLKKKLTPEMLFVGV